MSGRWLWSAVFVAIFMVGAAYDATQGQGLAAGVKAGLASGLALVAILNWDPVQSRWSLKAAAITLAVGGAFVWWVPPLLWGKSDLIDGFLFISSFFVAMVAAFGGLFPLVAKLIEGEVA